MLQTMLNDSAPHYRVHNTAQYSLEIEYSPVQCTALNCSVRCSVVQWSRPYYQAAASSEGTTAAHCLIYTLCTEVTVHCTIVPVHCTTVTVHCTTVTVHCTAVRVHCTTVTVHCTTVTVHCSKTALQWCRTKETVVCS